MGVNRKKTLQTSAIEEHGVYPLKGNSGCSIVLIETSTQKIVRKISRSQEYNSRLQEQCLKQKNYRRGHVAKAPEIFQSGINDLGLFFFDMQYVNGQTLSHHIETSRFLHFEKIAETLVQLLDSKASAVDHNFSNAFQQKIESISESVPRSKLVEKAIKILMSYRWQPCLMSYCHGDLTFENILINQDGEIYLIDFLDSFYNSWIIDVAKILQDLELQWSFRDFSKNSNRSVRISAIKHYFLDFMSRRPDGEEVLRTAYHILILNILRIYPYCRDNELAFIESLLQNSMNKAEKWS